MIATIKDPRLHWQPSLFISHFHIPHAQVKLNYLTCPLCVSCVPTFKPLHMPNFCLEGPSHSTPTNTASSLPQQPHLPAKIICNTSPGLNLTYFSKSGSNITSPLKLLLNSPHHSHFFLLWICLTPCWYWLFWNRRVWLKGLGRKGGR